MSQFNTDVEGRIAVGGSASFFNFGGASQIGADSQKELVVGGALAWTNGQLGQGGTGQGLVQGAVATSSFGGSISNGPVSGVVDFTAAQVELLTKSAEWGALTANGTANYQSWGGYFLNGTDSDLNIFSISAANLATTNTFNLTAPTGSTVLINVYGSAATFQNAGISLNGVTAENILFNFVDAGSLTMQGIGIKGSVLAPKASVNFNNGHIDGQLIVSTLYGSGESHNKLFQGNLDRPDVQTPEPSSFSFALIGAGAVAFGLYRRRCS